MKTRKRGLEFLDKFLIFISFILLCVSVAWIGMDYSDQFAKDTDERRIIGRIISIRNVVKRKYDNSLVWYNIEEGTPLYEDDWIFTGAGSKVVIQFNDGGTLTIEPDSIIVLNQEKGKLNLSLAHGSFLADLKSDTSITIDNNGKKETITASKSKVKVVDTKSLSKIAILEGTAEIAGQKIKENEQVQVDEKGVTKQELFVILNEPESYSTHWYEDGQKVKFSWETSVDVDEYTLEMSQDPDFTNPTRKAVKTNSYEFPIRKLGTYYWRVKATKGKESVFSDGYAFTFKRSFAPLTKIPEADKKIYTEVDSKENAYVEFEWNDKFKIWTYYSLQIAKDKEFSQITYTHDDLISELFLEEFKDSGEYFWRVRGYDRESGKTSNWSRPNRFELTVRRPKEQPPVAILNDNIYYQLKKKDIEFVSAQGEVSVDHKVNKLEAQWVYDLDVKHFEVRIARDENFEKIIDEFQVEDKKARFDRTYLGKTYFQVTPVFKNLDSAPSATGIIHTYLPRPITKAIFSDRKSFELEWDELVMAKEYRYEVELQRNDKKNNEQILTTNHKLKLPAAKTTQLSYKVRLVEAESVEPLSHFSPKTSWSPAVEPAAARPVASVELPPGELPPEKLPVPSFTKPPKRKTFIVMKKNPLFVVFRWDYGLTYKEFELEIGRGKNLDQILVSKKIDRKKFVMKRALPDGIYYYRVRVVEGDIPHEWSEVQSFRVLHK
jgi:hypothetical protein